MPTRYHRWKLVVQPQAYVYKSLLMYKMRCIPASLNLHRCECNCLSRSKLKSVHLILIEGHALLHMPGGKATGTRLLHHRILPVHLAGAPGVNILTRCLTSLFLIFQQLIINPSLTEVVHAVVEPVHDVFMVVVMCESRPFTRVDRRHITEIRINAAAQVDSRCVVGAAC